MKILEAINKGIDGVYILGYSGINSDAVYLEVQKDGKRVEKTGPIYSAGRGDKFYDDVINQAKELADKYDVKVFDGTSLNFSNFSGNYFIDDYSGDKFTSRGAEKVQFTDNDIDSYDDRPVNTVKWAICTEPGKFDIYDRVTKNPSDMYRVRVDFLDSESTKIRNLKKFFDDHRDKVYQGTWNDIKDGNYLILVNNHRYSSEAIKDIFNKILDADLKINDQRISGEIVIGKTLDQYDEEIDDVISFNFSDKWIFSSDIRKIENKIQMVYDAYTCVGRPFPEKFYITDSEGRNSSQIYVGLIFDGDVDIVTQSDIDRASSVYVGTLIHYSRFGRYDHSRFDDQYPIYVVVDVDEEGGVFKAVYCSSVKTDHWDRSEYRLDRNLMNDALNGRYSKNSAETIALLDDSYAILSSGVQESVRRNKMNVENLFESLTEENKVKVAKYMQSLFESDETLYGVFEKGGSIGSASHGYKSRDGKLCSVHKTADGAKDHAKRLRKTLTPGEKSYYGMGYTSRKLTKGEMANSEVQQYSIEESIKPEDKLDIHNYIVQVVKNVYDEYKGDKEAKEALLKNLKLAIDYTVDEYDWE